MSRWVSIDPGLACDVATWETTSLTWLEQFPDVDHEVLEDSLAVVVIERVDARPGDPRPQDIVAINRAVYRLAGSARCEIAEYTPSQWGGQLPKPVKHAALWEILTPAEKALFPKGTAERIYAAVEKGSRANWRKKNGKRMTTSDFYGRACGSEVHNALDAACIGAVHCGRLKF